MKHTVTRDEQSFRPITLTITLESQHEAEVISAMLNFSPLVDAVSRMGVRLCDIRGEISETGINPSARITELADEFSKTPWFLSGVRNR